MRSLTADAKDCKAASTHHSSHDPEHSQPCLPNTSQHTFRCYKTLYDKDLGAKETIRRYNGHIPGHPKYDVKMPLSDPRNHYIQFRTTQQADLCVPSFTVDRNTLFYPKVEVALFDLNDNVNNAFLQQLAVKVAFPVDLEVFYHPKTKKHMGMAMIVFTTFQESHRFVQEYNGKSVMGGQISCCHDPYFTLLSQRYEDATGEEMRTPVHLKNLEDAVLNTRRRQIAMKIASRRVRSSPLAQYITEKSQEEDMDMESPSGSNGGTIELPVKKHEQCNTDSDGITTTRRACSTERFHAPQIESTQFVSSPVGVTLPPTTFIPHIPPPVLPTLRPDFVSYHQKPNTTVPLMSPLQPAFAGVPYPPPPPYSALPSDVITFMSTNYPHLPTTSPFVHSASSDEKATTSRLHLPDSPVDSSRVKSSDRGRHHKRKKKKRKRHSSYSSSSDSSSNSSLKIGEYLRVEKKQSTKSKYISREGESQGKTIVEEIKTITKKKYRVTESRRNDIKQTGGLETISSDESVSVIDHIDNDSTKKVTINPKPSDKERKVEGHRWSSTSTDSDDEQCRKIDQKNEKLAAASLHDFSAYAPNSSAVTPHPFTTTYTTCPSYTTAHAAGHMQLPSIDLVRNNLSTGTTISHLPTYLPPLNLSSSHVNPSLGAPFNPLFPPPSIHLLNSEAHAKRELPKVALRFVEDSPTCHTTSSTAAQQTLADRVASIFGGNPSSSNFSKLGSSGIQRSSLEFPHRDELEDIDVKIGSSSNPPAVASTSFSNPGSMQFRTKNKKGVFRGQRKSSEAQKMQFVRNVVAVREATEKTIGEEIVDIVSKDFYKRIEVISFEILEEVLLELRHELEEQKRNEAQEALRAQAQLITSEKPSDVAQLVSPFAASLNTTSEKLANFSFTINMPKLPSFRRKVRPPSPESDSCESTATQFSAEDSDHSSGAQKSSPSSKINLPDENLIHKRRARRLRSSHSGSESLSDSSSVDSERCHVKSPHSAQTSLLKSDACIAPSAASSSRSLSSSDEENHDESAITEREYIPDVQDVCYAPEIEVLEKPLWERIVNESSLEWSEIMPRALYHVNLSEHCYFKLLDDDEETNKQNNVPELDRKVVVRKKAKLNKHERELLGLLPVVENYVPRRPLIVYPPWSNDDKLKHIYKWDCCFDPEDQEYLRQAWSTLQSSDDNASSSPWSRRIRFNFSSWSNKPRLLDKPTKKGRVDQYLADSDLDGILPIEDGCARTRGFFKMSMKEKRRLIRRPEDEQRDTTLISERDETAVRHNLVLTKESRSMHRRLLTTMGDTNTDFFKVNQLKYRKKMIKFARSRIHGWGLYAMETIAPDDMIVEYVGQKVRNTVADVREKAYVRRGIGSSYLFRIDDTAVIDATRMGNFARFINHSCQPNCYAKVVTVDGDKRIVIYSKTLINKGDEITYDYKFPIEEDKVDCLCGAPNCRGTLN